MKGRQKCKRPSGNDAGIYVKRSSTHIGNTDSKDSGNTFLTGIGKDEVLQQIIDYLIRKNSVRAGDERPLATRPGQI